MLSNCRKLTTEEQKELDDWLPTKKIELNHRTRRELSDVVNMAQLFKNVAPKLVDMNNYTSHGKLSLKLHNWETFNLKVLRKTGLILKRESLGKLASGELSAIRSILFHLMRIERYGLQCSPRIRALSNTQDLNERLTDCTLTSQEDAPEPEASGEPSDGQATTEAPQEPTAKDYDSLLVANCKKDKYISTLHHKIHYLEKVVIEKDARINQLLDHLSTLSVRIIALQTSLNYEDQQDEPSQEQ